MNTAVLARFKRPSAPTRFLLAAALYLSAFALRFWILPANAGLAFLTFYPAVIVGFLLCGTGPGALLLATSAVTGFYCFFAPYGSFDHDLAAWTSTAIFLLSCTGIGAIVAHLRRIEAKLGAAAAEIEDLFDNAPTGYHSLDAQGVFLRVNRTECDWLGCSREELVGRATLLDFMGDEGRAGFQARFPRFLADGHLQGFEWELVGRHGQRRIVSTSATAVRDGAGRFLMSRSVLFDITALKKVENALHALNHEQRAILNSDLLGIARVRDRAIIWASAGMERLFGYAPGRMAGLPTQRLFADPAHFDEKGDGGYAAILAGAVYSNESLMRRADGGDFWAQVNGVGLEGQSGETLWLFGDINRRKRAELHLAASQTLLARTERLAGLGGWSLDISTRSLQLSEQSRRMLEVPANHAPTLDQALALLPPDSRVALESAVRDGMRSNNAWDLELPMHSILGRRFLARLVGALEFEGGVPVRVSGALQDVTERRRIEREVAASHESLRVSLDSIGEAVITTDAASTVVWLNRVAEKLTGWPKEEAIGRPLADVFTIIDEETRRAKPHPVSTCIAESRAVGLASDTVLRSRNGPDYIISDSAAPIRLDSGELLGAVLVFHDDSEHRRMSVELSYRATHDTLTGLTNRPEFEGRLERLIERLRRDPAVHAVLYIDLDRFKVVNDACGHAAGDILLRQIAGLLHEAVRGRDTVARLGGDEFGVILEHCDEEKAQRVARKICDTMDEFRFTHEGQRFRVGTSIGIVSLDQRWTSAVAVMQAADSACYAAKEAGRNRAHVWFDSDSSITTRKGEVNWVTRLEHAMDEDHFELYAQRIEPLDGSTPGLHLEILLRLREADGRVVAPGAFMGAAERYHLAGRIDRWVVRKVFEALVRCEEPAGSIALVGINLSGQTIGDRAFRRDVVHLVRASGLDASRLCFEITETAAITNLVDAKRFIEEVRNLGAKIALDDFGAGASSFGYLKSLPVDFLKIDGQFVKDMLEDPLDNAAVRCFIDVARTVGVRTIAEFVERREVFDALRAMGADMAQGYLLHRPEPLSRMVRMRGRAAGGGVRAEAD